MTTKHPDGLPRNSYGDLRVGSIEIYSIDGHDVATEDKDAIKIRDAKKVRCFVYASRTFQNAPYYLTRENTRVLVMDPKRVEFFPKPGVVPEGMEKTITNFELSEEEVQRRKEAEAAAAPPPPVKVGTITLQVPDCVKDEISKKIEWTFHVELRDVCIDREEFEEIARRREEKEKEKALKLIYEEPDPEPFFFVMSGKRKMKVAPERIHFLETQPVVERKK